MWSKFFHLMLLATFLAFAGGTKVAKCRDSTAPQLTQEEIEISACEGPPCTLKKKTEPSISIKLKPNKDVKEVTTLASAYIVGVPLPFIGVDGTSACPNMYSEDGKSNVGCPLKAGKNYLYKNSFHVLEIYPKIGLSIHWALADNSTREHLLCFELQAKIT